MATLRESKIRGRGAQRAVPPGTVLTGYRELAKRTGIASTTVIRQIKYLEQTESIQIECGAEGTLITICKWGEYQLNHLEGGTQAKQERDESEYTAEYTTAYASEYATEYTSGTLLNKRQRTTNQEQETKEIAPELPLADAAEVTVLEGEPEPTLALAARKRQPKEPPPTAETRRTYSDAFIARWRIAPKWNVTVGGQLAHFIRRVGKNDAPLVAEFYLQHNDRYYVKNMHPVGFLLKDAEKLYAEWKSGRMITHLQATTV